MTSASSEARMAHLKRKHWAGPSALRAQRLASGLTLQALADSVGCSHMTLARAERGEKVADGMALRIAEALSVPVGWLFPEHPDAEAVRAACGGHLELEAA